MHPCLARVRSHALRPLSLTVLLTAQLTASSSLAETYEVGDGEPLTTLGAVPWETLAAGDEVRIHYRAQPYREKLVLAVSGSQAAPIRIVGVAGPAGQRPVIDGDKATTRSELDYWGEERGVIKIGGASKPSAELGGYLELVGLEIRGGRSTHGFTGHDGSSKTYADNAAAIFVEHGEHVTIRDCALFDSGNGLFVANASRDIRVEYSEIAGNGNPNSNFEHNVYSEALGIVYEGNQLGALCAGCPGNNLKDRSAGTVIRYNWIEGGNRQLDLVESDSEELRADARYAETFVYGNVLVENDDLGNRQIVHWGGDNGTSSTYRTGVLYLYANTIVSKRVGRTSLLRNSSPSGRADIYGNIVQCGAGVGQLEILADALGRATLRNNWLTLGFTASFAGSALVDADASNLSGGDPGFTDLINGNYMLAQSSVCVNSGAFPQVGASYAVTGQAPMPRTLEGRPMDGLPDIGALERGTALPWDGGTSDAGSSDAGSSSGGSQGGGAVGPGGGVMPVPDGGFPPDENLPSPAAPTDDSGCECTSQGTPASGAGWPLLMGLLLELRRRRKTHAAAPKTRG